jgi:hypothetical protein
VMEEIVPAVKRQCSAAEGIGQATADRIC